MSLADVAAATLAFLNLQPGATTATIEAKTNFLAAVREGSVTARGELVHVCVNRATREPVPVPGWLREAASPDPDVPFIDT